MKFNKKTLSETIQSQLSGKKTFTDGKKQNVVISEEQLERLLERVNSPVMIESVISDAFKLIRKAIVKENLDLNLGDYSETIISESQDEWRGHNPGASAAAGIENIISGVKKAYEMIKDGDTRRKLANSITKLGNFMSYTAELVGSGSSQRAPRSYDEVSDDMPYPELEEGVYAEEMDEAAKPDFLDLDKDGNKKESMKKAAKDMKEDSGHDEAMNYGRDEGHDDKELYDLKHDGGSEDHIDDLEDDMHYDHINDSDNIEETKEDKTERLIREDIKKMKQVIKPIERI
jgi:hypothetical protein|tara:strand:- start:533 stop:1396 length:864 start_codon:yes stop_codon:yes gene_type:complete